MIKGTTNIPERTYQKRDYNDQCAGDQNPTNDWSYLYGFDKMIKIY